MKTTPERSRADSGVLSQSPLPQATGVGHLSVLHENGFVLEVVHDLSIALPCLGTKDLMSDEQMKILYSSLAQQRTSTQEQKKCRLTVSVSEAAKTFPKLACLKGLCFDEPSGRRTGSQS